MSVEELATRRWSRDEYFELADAGKFRNLRVELVDGEIVSMSPQKPSHAKAIVLAASTLRRTFGERAFDRQQMPLSLGEVDEPEPDIAMIEGSPHDYDDHPTSALLVVEVSDSSLAYDRGTKASLYARAGISEYWIVNLIDRTLEVHRRPVADENARFGSRYAESTVIAADREVTPVGAPEATVSVAALLP